VPDLDSRSRRASSVNLLKSYAATLVLPDGTISAADRQHTAWAYSGILAAAPVEPPPDKIGGDDAWFRDYVPAPHRMTREEAFNKLLKAQHDERRRREEIEQTRMRNLEKAQAALMQKRISEGVILPPHEQEKQRMAQHIAEQREAERQDVIRLNRLLNLTKANAAQRGKKGR
jgi:hypothetical protein